MFIHIYAICVRNMTMKFVHTHCVFCLHNIKVSTVWQDNLKNVCVYSARSWTYTARIIYLHAPGRYCVCWSPFGSMYWYTVWGLFFSVSSSSLFSVDRKHLLLEPKTQWVKLFQCVNHCVEECMPISMWSIVRVNLTSLRFPSLCLQASVTSITIRKFLIKYHIRSNIRLPKHTHEIKDIHACVHVSACIYWPIVSM